MLAYLKSKKPDTNYRNEKPLFEVEKPEMGDIYKHDGKYYYVEIFVNNNAHQYIVVNDMPVFSDNGLHFGEFQEITCPFCLNEHTGTYNNVNGMIIHGFKCKRCGSEFNFEKIVKTTYVSTPVKANRTREIGGE